MTELSFLIDLLLNHELSKETKSLIASRIKDVEQNLTQPRVATTGFISHMPLVGPPQAASTLALMAKHGDIPNHQVTPVAPDPTPHVLTDGEINARQKSMEILKGRKQQHLKV